MNFCTCFQSSPRNHSLHFSNRTLLDISACNPQHSSFPLSVNMQLARTLGVNLPSFSAYPVRRTVNSRFSESASLPLAIISPPIDCRVAAGPGTYPPQPVDFASCGVLWRGAKNCLRDCRRSIIFKAGRFRPRSRSAYVRYQSRHGQDQHSWGLQYPQEPSPESAYFCRLQTGGCRN